MLTSIDVKFIFNCLVIALASLGDKELFSNANILQIAMIVDVVRRVVFLLIVATFLANSSHISFSWNEWNVPPFCTHYQNWIPFPGLLG